MQLWYSNNKQALRETAARYLRGETAHSSLSAAVTVAVAAALEAAVTAAVAAALEQQ